MIFIPLIHNVPFEFWMTEQEKYLKYQVQKKTLTIYTILYVFVN